jgi:hypothetical protein
MTEILLFLNNDEISKFQPIDVLGACPRIKIYEMKFASFLI